MRIPDPILSGARWSGDMYRELTSWLESGIPGEDIRESAISLRHLDHGAAGLVAFGESAGVVTLTGAYQTVATASDDRLGVGLYWGSGQIEVENTGATGRVTARITQAGLQQRARSLTVLAGHTATLSVMVRVSVTSGGRIDAQLQAQTDGGTMVGRNAGVYVLGGARDVE